MLRAKENQVVTYKRKAATKQIRKLFEAGKYEEFARLYIPDLVMDKEYYWSVIIIYLKRTI